MRCMGISPLAPTLMRWLLARWSVLPCERLQRNRGSCRQWSMAFTAK